MVRKLYVNTFNDNSVVGSHMAGNNNVIFNPSDKRDLLLVFGLDQKIQQKKDSFFHNATNNKKGYFR